MHAALWTDRRAFGQLLREIRMQAGLTQSTVAEAAGMNRASLSALEQGKRNVLASEFLCLLKLYGCDLSSFDVEEERASEQKRRVAQQRVITRLLAHKPDQATLSLLQALAFPQEKLESIAALLLHVLIEAECT